MAQHSCIDKDASLLSSWQTPLQIEQDILNLKGPGDNLCAVHVTSLLQIQLGPNFDLFLCHAHCVKVNLVSQTSPITRLACETSSYKMEKKVPNISDLYL